MKANLFRNISIFVHVKIRDALDALHRRLLSNPGVAVIAAGGALTALPFAANAGNGITGLLTGWGDAVNKGIDFTMLVALAVGVGAIFWGCKLIVDKSAERGDVKNSHIVVALAGGSFLCILWVIITLLVETSGGSSGDIGKGRS